MRRRTVFAALACLGALAVVRIAIAAAAAIPFQEQAFAASQQADAPILVEIDASWCPVCAVQRPILQKLSAEPAFRNLVVYRVDFDSQKDVVRQMGARQQSTLIVFHGKDERGRSTGATNEADIRALLVRASS
jgi:thioredoxin 1